jgi:hypothetical protein
MGMPSSNSVIQPHGEFGMETRLIIAYLLIALLVGLAVFGAVKIAGKRREARRRNSGRNTLS